METSVMNSGPEALLNLAGCFDYPSRKLAGELKLDLAELEHNHVRLFINDRGGVKAPPYAGCYLNHDDRRRFMIEFSGICLRHGIVLGPSQPPDHIPAMLEALALLLAETGDTADPEISELLDRYYSHWPEAFAQALSEHDQSGFYATVAEELKETLAGLRRAPGERSAVTN